MAIDFDPRTQEVVIPCRFVEGSKLEYRSLHFQKSESKAGWYGSKVWIEDQDELKFGVSVELDPNVVGHVITREYTDRDVLSIESTYPENSDHCTEQYTQNGRILTCNFDPNAIDQDTIDAFDAFYDRSTSLENNADGNWMMGLLASSDFQSWFEDEAARGGKRDRDGEGSSCPWWLSWGSAGCTFLKCSFGGGILNPLCHACTGTSWACWIAEAVCHWGNC